MSFVIGMLLGFTFTMGAQILSEYLDLRRRPRALLFGIALILACAASMLLTGCDMARADTIDTLIDVHAREIAQQQAGKIVDRNRLEAHLSDVQREIDGLNRELAVLEGEAKAIERLREQVHSVALPKSITDTSAP